MNGAGMCKIVSRGDEVLLEGEGEKRHRSKVEPGLRKISSSHWTLFSSL